MFLGNQKVRISPSFSPYRHSHVFIHKPISPVVTLRRFRNHIGYPIRARSIYVTSSHRRRDSACLIRRRRRRYHSYSHISSRRSTSVFTTSIWVEDTQFYNLKTIYIYIRNSGVDTMIHNYHLNYRTESPVWYASLNAGVFLISPGV